MEIKDCSWNEVISKRFNHPLLPRSIRGIIVGKSGCGKTTIDTIASHISKAMMDNFISDEEFKLIMDELNKYKAMKEEIRNNTKKILNVEEEESLIEKGRQEARESFRKLVEKGKTL